MARRRSARMGTLAVLVATGATLAGAVGAGAVGAVGAVGAAPSVLAVKVPGTWTLNWDWAKGEGSGSAPITFSAKGHTFTVTGESGTWTKKGTRLTFVYTSSNSCHGTWTGTEAKAAPEFSGSMHRSTTRCGSDTGTWSITKPATTTSLKLSAASVGFGHEQQERFRVLVTASSGSAAPAGSVAVKAGKTTLCALKLSSGTGSCTMARTKLSPGTYRVLASFGGGTSFGPSASPRLTLKVTKAT